MSTIQHRTTTEGHDRYRVIWRDSPGGRQQVRTFTTRKSAENWRALLDVVGGPRALSALREVVDVTETMTVAEQVAAHIDGLTGITDGTRRAYRSHLKRIIEPSLLGGMPLAALHREDVAAWVNELDERGVAAKTIANYHGLISASLRTAVEQGRLTSNPSAGLRLPRGDHAARQITFLTPAQFQTLHDAMTEHYRPLILALVGTGMRFGEATALRVRDLNLADGSATITRAWQYTGKAQRKIGSPKTQRSTRTIAIPTQVVDLLAPLTHRRAVDDYVLLAPKGGPIRQSVFFTPWKAAVAGLEVTPRIHDLRHTFASWAIQAGVPLPVIQRQLGHESITTTVNTYGHLARSDFDAMAARISERLPSLSQIQPPRPAPLS